MEVPGRVTKTMVAGGLLWAAFSAASAWADTVVLSNGDRLTGSVLLMDRGKLVFKTDYAGEVRIDWDKVAQLETDDPVYVRGQDLPADFEARLTAGTAEGQVAATTGADQAFSQQELALGSIKRIARPHDFMREWSFRGGLDLSLDASHASSTNQNWSAAAYAVLRRDTWRHGINLDYARNKQDGVVGTHNYSAAYALDRFVSEKVFLRGRLRYGRDQVDNPARQFVASVGPGYQFWDDESGAFALTAMVSHNRYRYHDDSRDSFRSAGVGWDFTQYLDAKQWQIYSTGDYQKALGRAGDYSFEAAIGLRYRLSEWLSLYANTSYNRVRIEGQPSSNERRYSVGLGMHW